jgi:membrane protease YdiL (CAAX protease family)
MTRHPLPLFFTAAFALPWAIWGTTLAEQAGWVGWHLPTSLAFWIGLPLATFGTAAVTGGWRAIRELLSRMIRVRVRPLWWILTLLVTPITAAAALLVGVATGTQMVLALPLTAILGTLLLDAWMFLLSEEVAWRGYALPRMEKRMTPLIAALVLGVVWALWHTPLFFIAGSFQSSVPPVGFILSTVATSVTISWIFHRARGSVLVAAVFHAVTDVTIASTGVMTSGGTLLWIFVAAQVIVSAVAGTDLARRPRARRSFNAGRVTARSV